MVTPLLVVLGKGTSAFSAEPSTRRIKLVSILVRVMVIPILVESAETNSLAVTDTFDSIDFIDLKGLELAMGILAIVPLKVIIEGEGPGSKLAEVVGTSAITGNGPLLSPRLLLADDLRECP